MIDPLSGDFIINKAISDEENRTEETLILQAKSDFLSFCGEFYQLLISLLT